uniref:UPF0480 protein C35D10.1 n=1 Tax=Aceria tosichella TaxID=561515 RepID=A0A6G1SF13_9ACAR
MRSQIRAYILAFISIITIFSTFTVYCALDESSTNKEQQSGAPNKEKPQQSCDTKLNKITGNIFSLQHDDLTTLRMSLMNTRILVNYGQYVGYPREDGTFEIDNLPPDSYVVEVTHPRYIYEPMRVDITSKGRIRARRVNHIQPALVQTLDYPLKFKPRSLHNYFLPRETWRIMDLLLNPMVIMMVVPLGIIWLLPKMMNPQEVQSQRENMQMPEYNVPELSEMMASMFGQQKQQSSNEVAGSTSQPALTSGGTGAANRHGRNRRR